MAEFMFLHSIILYYKILEQLPFEGELFVGTKCLCISVGGAATGVPSLFALLKGEVLDFGGATDPTY